MSGKPRPPRTPAQTFQLARRHSARTALLLAILAALMLIVAAFIEGFLRQLIQDPTLRLTIGWGMGLFWTAWLLLSGRERKHPREPAQ